MYYIPQKHKNIQEIAQTRDKTNSGVPPEDPQETNIVAVHTTIEVVVEDQVVTELWKNTKPDGQSKGETKTGTNNAKEHTIALISLSTLKFGHTNADNVSLKLVDSNGSNSNAYNLIYFMSDTLDSVNNEQSSNNDHCN